MPESTPPRLVYSTYKSSRTAAGADAQAAYIGDSGGPAAWRDTASPAPAWQYLGPAPGGPYPDWALEALHDAAVPWHLEPHECVTPGLCRGAWKLIRTDTTDRRGFLDRAAPYATHAAYLEALPRAEVVG